MPITLTELVREFAQAAVAMDDVCAQAAHANFLDDCDHTPDPAGAGFVRVPQTERVKVGPEQQVDVPTATLHDQAGLQAKALRLSVSSDVDLEGRQIETDAETKRELVYETVEEYAFHGGAKGTRYGYETKLNVQYGEVDDSTVEMNGHTYTIASIFYSLNKNQCVLRVAEMLEREDWEGALLKLESGENTTTLHFDQANWNHADTTGSIHWVEQLQLKWLVAVSDAGGSVTVTIMRPIKVEQEITDELPDRHTHRSEVLVTFREGLSANSAKLTIAVEFERAECAEGVSLIRDRMNQDLSHKLR